jgi:hypothetical protein
VSCISRIGWNIVTGYLKRAAKGMVLALRASPPPMTDLLNLRWRALTMIKTASLLI